MRNSFGTHFTGRRTLLTLSVVLVGLLLAKSCLFVAVGQPPLEGDARHYWADGERMASGDWLLARGELETIRTPGYPLFLALFQIAFGHYALIAASIGQQLMVFTTVMLAAWISARISGSWLGGLCGLALGLFCVSQDAVADYMLSDTLFTLLLTLAVAALVAWFERPIAAAAIAVGLLLGLATLVRPIAQLAWGPILLAMAVRWSNSRRPTNLRPVPGEGQEVRAIRSLAFRERGRG
jgi:4-amino-4-deoxy-L-arabinose transferase-like glycosyltransferase